MLKSARLLLATALLGACGAVHPSAAAPSEVAVGSPAPAIGSLRSVMYLARRHWHIDVGFPVQDLSPSLAFIARRFPRARYVFFGFGDRHYLLAKRRGSSTLSGALIPGPGMILVTAIENSPAEAFGAPHVLELSVPATDAAAAQRFVRRSLSGDSLLGDSPSSDEAADVPSFADGPYEGSLYYSAAQRYSALHTCNTWAAEVLNSAGLPVRTRLVLFAGQLWRQASRLAARARPPPSISGLLWGVPAPEYAHQPQSQGGGLPF